MASDSVGYQSEVDGRGGGQRALRALRVEDAESGVSESINQQAKEWVRGRRWSGAR